jgi:hypothetical protein
MESGDGGLPQNANTAGHGMIRHGAMLVGAANPIRGSAGKRSPCNGALIHKPDAAERIAFIVRNRDAERLQSVYAVWHQAFAARLIDGRHGSIRQQHTQTLGASGNCRCETRRSTSNYKNIPRVVNMAQHES